jgi:hypothetical protein
MCAQMAESMAGGCGHFCPFGRGDRRQLAAADCLEAVQAVHRTRAGRNEGHLGRFSAVRADHVVHDPRAAVALSRPPRGPALRATPWFVLQPARLVELLLPSAEQKFAPTVATRQGPIHKTHRPGLPSYLAQRPGRWRPVYPSSVVRGDSSAVSESLAGGLPTG